MLYYAKNSSLDAEIWIENLVPHAPPDVSSSPKGRQRKERKDFVYVNICFAPTKCQ
jgi:hypothetical protein